MSQDSGAAGAVGGSSTNSLPGRSATPTQPTVNMGSTYPPMSTLLNHPGLRYPICLQGGSLIYSPVMGQTLFPWRPFTPVATPTTPVSAVVPNVNLMTPPTQSTPPKPVSLASLMQVPNYSYMTVSSLLGATPNSEEATQQQYTGGAAKRDLGEIQSPQAVKRPRVSHEIDSQTGVSGTQNSPLPGTVQSGSSAASPTDMLYYHQQPSLLRFSNHGDHGTRPLNIVLLKCLGTFDNTLVEQYNVKVLSLLQELFHPPRSTYGTTPPTLPPETHILLTINYLNSLRNGECISFELMKWNFQTTLVSENQWVNYYHKHKKMTESTFVQLQFSHLARISAQLSSDNVMVIVSQNSLTEGIVMALQGIRKSDQSVLPKFLVVIAVNQNIPSEMCVLVIDNLQCKWLAELYRSSKSSREPQLQRLLLPRNVLTAMKRAQLRLGDNVHAPFFVLGGKELVTKKEVDEILPPLSSTVEHRPKGPYRELYDVALVMLQRVINVGHMDRFQKLDFFLFSPSYPPLVSQLVKDVQESGLIQLLGIGNHRDEILQAISQRIVFCTPNSIESMNDVIQGNRHVLFLVISKCSHITSYVTLKQRGVIDPNPTLDENRSCDCRSVMSHPNVTVFHNSAQPYALLTNRSLFNPSNEIHWPRPSSSLIAKHAHKHPDISSGMEFCSLLRYESSVPVQDWADVREDAAFEERVLKLCATEKFATPICSIRAQVLLTDYSSALLSVGRRHTHGTCHALPETRSIINELVRRPLTSGRGQGTMVILRCHNKAIGTDIYNKLKGVRNTLGLQYRFEIILDHGDDKIVVSDYFQKRLNCWGVSSSISYLDLQYLPCLLIMTGRVRPSVRLPSSLNHIDMRLCHAHLTRTLYESDMSLVNSYRNLSPSSSHKHHSPLGSYKSDKHTSTASSSSMFSGDAHVVEWKPTKDADHTHWDKGNSPSFKSTQFEYNNSEMDCTETSALNGGVAIVEIPQPEDHMTTSYNETVPDSEGSIFNDLDSNSDYDESETETDDDIHPRMTCLLSRQYYLIWESGTVVNQSLLLPPSDGVIWQTSSKWTHLSDHTPSAQSFYYRAWSKPEGKAKRVAMDTVVKEHNEARRRSFLLTGPTQVGKTGACLLLVRLLHEYLRSSRGVTAVSRSPVPLPLVTHALPSSPVATSFSPVVSIDYLTTNHREGDTPTPYRPSPEEPKHNTILINAHPNIAHDSSHSCPKCSSVPSSAETTPTINYTLSSVLETNVSTYDVQWSIPSNKTDLVVMATNHAIECIKLPLSDIDHTPSHHTPILIFSISPDLKESALLNLSHLAENHLHIVITKSSNFSTYQNIWPSHIIAALPDTVFSGTGSCFNAVKSLGQWNYSQNTARNNEAVVLPWLLVLNDSVCMVLKDGEEKSVDLSSVLDELIQDNPADLCSLRHWCHTLETPRPHPSSYALDSHFMLLNLSTLTDLNFNPLNFKSSDIDYHLRLLSNGYRVSVPSGFNYVRKHIKPDKPVSLVELSPQLLSHPDRLVTSLHHDTSSLLSYPGPLLLETFLLHKSLSLFPSTNFPANPVLMIENYINLGPRVHVSLLSCRQLEETVDQVVYGGLVLYLCEGMVSSKMLQGLKFVHGACLLLITRDCKALVREVSRLDIEEYWHFKLRDEFQTACGDSDQPLFFLTGKYVSVS